MKSFTLGFISSAFFAISACGNPFVKNGSKQPEDSSADRSTTSGFTHGETLAKLETIVIPQTPLVKLPLIDLLALIQKKSVELDTLEADTAKKGIHFDVWDPGTRIGRTRHEDDGGEYSSLSLPIDDERWMAEISLSEESMKLGHLIVEVARRSNLDVYLTPQGIVLVPEGSDPNPEGRDDVEIWQALRKSIDSH